VASITGNVHVSEAFTIVYKITLKSGNVNSLTCKQVAQRMCSTYCGEPKLLETYGFYFFGENYGLLFNKMFFRVFFFFRHWTRS
jgi:hypothetical protein